MYQKPYYLRQYHSFGTVSRDMFPILNVFGVHRLHRITSDWMFGDGWICSHRTMFPCGTMLADRTMVAGRTMLTGVILTFRSVVSYVMFGDRVDITKL